MRFGLIYNSHKGGRSTAECAGRYGYVPQAQARARARLYIAHNFAKRNELRYRFRENTGRAKNLGKKINKGSGVQTVLFIL